MDGGKRLFHSRLSKFPMARGLRFLNIVHSIAVQDVRIPRRVS